MKGSEEVKKNIIKFLKLCVKYTNNSLERKNQRLEQMDSESIIALQKEIEKWKTYKQFTEYTIEEISNGDLDEWIKNLDNPDFNPIPGNNLRN